MLNYTEKHNINVQLKDVLKNIFIKEIESNDIVEKIERTYLEEYWKMTKAKDDVNEHLINTFKAVAQMYGFKFDLWTHLDIKDVQKTTTQFLEKLESKIASGTTPKKRVLTFSVNDDDGHHDVYTVTTKDMKFVNGALSARVYECDESNLLENILDSDSPIKQKLLDLAGTSEDDIWNSECNTFELVKQIYSDYINDDTITVTQFAEYLEEIIATGRHEGDAKWVTI